MSRYSRAQVTCVIIYKKRRRIPTERAKNWIWSELLLVPLKSYDRSRIKSSDFLCRKRDLVGNYAGTTLKTKSNARFRPLFATEFGKRPGCMDLQKTVVSTRPHGVQKDSKSGRAAWSSERQLFQPGRRTPKGSNASRDAEIPNGINARQAAWHPCGLDMGRTTGSESFIDRKR